MKSPFPFDPLEDNLLGKILAEIAESRKERDLLKKAVYSHSSSSQFFFTPNASKQVVMNTFPVQLRSWIEAKDYSKLKKELSILIQGSAEKKQNPSMDLFMELAEWIITGFEDMQLKQEILNLFTNYQYKIEQSDIQELQKKYEETLKEDFENGK
jgi:hypothetical protein